MTKQLETTNKNKHEHVTERKTDIRTEQSVHISYHHKVRIILHKIC